MVSNGIHPVYYIIIPDSKFVGLLNPSEKIVGLLEAVAAPQNNDRHPPVLKGDDRRQILAGGLRSARLAAQKIGPDREWIDVRDGMAALAVHRLNQHAREARGAQYFRLAFQNVLQEEQYVARGS